MANRFLRALLIFAVICWLLPAPAPPTPGPTPIVDPIGAGTAVLIVEETADRPSLPKGQFDAVTSLELRKWMDSNKVTYRVWDREVKPVGEAKGWQEALDRPRKGEPWIIISNGKKGYEGFVPMGGVDATKELIKKYIND